MATMIFIWQIKLNTVTFIITLDAIVLINIRSISPNQYFDP